MTDVSPTTSALICTLPRSGSWLLAEYLHNCDVAGTPEEYFRADNLDWYMSRWDGQSSATSIRDYVRLSRHNTCTDNGVFSAKLHWYQMSWLLTELRRSEPGPATDLDLLQSAFPGARYIHLVRADAARQAVSWYRAIQTDAWFQITEPTSPKRPVNPDFQQVRWLEDLIVEHRTRWAEFFHRTAIEPLTVRFEDLVAQPDRTVRRVLDYIGADYPASVPLPPGRLRSQSDQDTTWWLAAYRQVRNALAPKDSSMRWDNEAKRFVRAAAG